MVAGLMLFDMMGWKDKDLGWIARKMDNIERRLEMAVALAAADFCGINHSCSCSSLTSCNTFCS